MDIRYSEKNEVIELELTRDSNGDLFQAIAEEIAQTFKIQWKEKLSGLDQRYWDFEINGIILTLHLEHYLGISIFADKTKTDIEKAKINLKEIGEHFKAWKPTT